MLNKSSVLGVCLAAALVSGCASHTGTGVFVGGASGAVLGGVIGGGQGALIGGAAGIIAGGLVGASLDNREASNLKNQSLDTYRKVDHGSKLSVDDVIHLSKADISDQTIIYLIQKTHSRFHLNCYQVDKLHEAGVSEQVIDYMLDPY